MEKGGDAVDRVAGAVFSGVELEDLGGELADSVTHVDGVWESGGVVGGEVCHDSTILCKWFWLRDGKPLARTLR